MKETSVNHHPSEDLLEKFARNRCSDEEVELVETHFLACESCVTKLEELDDFVQAFQSGYEELRQRRSQSAKRLSFQWAFALASLAVLGVSLSFLPRLSRNGNHASLPSAQVRLLAERGSEAVIAPASRALQVQLSATDLPQTTLAVEVVDSVGSPIWKGSTQVTHDGAVLSLPPMRVGTYFLRLYDTPNHASDPLREFAFQIK